MTSHISNADLKKVEGKLDHDEQTQEILDSFKAKFVGFGVWYVNHILSSHIVKNFHTMIDPGNKMMTVYICFIVYCKFIYCGICRHHAAGQIQKTSITSKIEIPTEETANLLFDWFYDFHKAANTHAKKSSPSKEHVRNYFLNGIDSDIHHDTYTYENIQNGMWHYFFLLSTKCHSHEHISCLYYIILEFMPYLPSVQRQLFVSFCSTHRFTDALNDHTISGEELCICFFDWLHAMYYEINSKSGIKVYPKETLNDIYFYLDVCSKDCDK